MHDNTQQVTFITAIMLFKRSFRTRISRFSPSKSSLFFQGGNLFDEIRMTSAHVLGATVENIASQGNSVIRYRREEGRCFQSGPRGIGLIWFPNQPFPTWRPQLVFLLCSISSQLKTDLVLTAGACEITSCQVPTSQSNSSQVRTSRVSASDSHQWNSFEHPFRKSLHRRFSRVEKNDFYPHISEVNWSVVIPEW